MTKTRYFLITSLIFICNIATALTLYETNLDKTITHKVDTSHKINLINCKNYKCDAINALAFRVKATYIGDNNPASAQCKKRNGSNQILEDKNKNQYDYCKFKDSSMIDSWNLVKEK